MKQIILILTLIMGFSSLAQQSYKDINFEGETRNYYKYLPTGFDSNTESLPLVIVLHGIGDNALNMSGVGFNQMADTARFIPVYLQGDINSFGQTSWNNGTLLGTTSNDILFISRIIDSVKSDHNIDLSRVYLTGFSMGSIMTYKGGLELSDRIAAIACFSGPMSSQSISQQPFTTPLPTLYFHGTADATVPYNGAPLTSLSLAIETIDRVKTLNGWNGDSTIVNIPDNVNDGVTIEKIIYDCTTPFEHWRMNGADHIFPYQPANDTSSIFVAWDWFSQYTHPNPVAVNIDDSNEMEQIEFYPNPATDKLFIKGYHNLRNISIFNINGQKVMNAENFDEILDISELITGLYIIQFTSLDGKVSQDKLVVK